MSLIDRSFMVTDIQTRFGRFGYPEGTGKADCGLHRLQYLVQRFALGASSVSVACIGSGWAERDISGGNIGITFHVSVMSISCGSA